MAGKKRILVLGLVGLVCFAGATVLSIFLGPRPRAPDANAAGTGLAPSAAGLTAGLPSTEAKLTPTEKQLEDLIRELRAKLEECRRRERQIEEREDRFALTQELLKKQVQELETLQVQLVGPLTALKEEQAKLENSRVRVAAEERANLKRAATIYEKMDPAQSSQILVGMCTGQQIDDVVKILHYMSERAAAKTLAEVPDKALAGKLTEAMKRVREEG